MKVLLAITLTAALCAGRAAYADCSYPPAPDHLPDGRTATMTEMVTAQKAVKEYDTAINAYLACIKLEHDDTISKMAPPAKDDKSAAAQQAAQKKAIDDMEIQKHNAAIDADHAIADRFNEQVRIFKAKAADQKK
jgi:hypothetical protein